MFDRFEQLLARHDLAQNLSRLQRKFAFVALALCSFFATSAIFGTVVALLALIGLVIAHKVMPKPTPVAASTSASAAVPTVRHRPVPELVAGFDAFMRPARDLLRRVPQHRRNATMIALLDIMEVFTELGQYLHLDGDDIRRAALAGDLPRLTKEADDLFAAGATLYLHSLVVNEQGRFMVVRLSLVDGTDVVFHWNVRMLGQACIYRIDQTQTTGR